LARRYHPDVNQEAEATEIFRKIQLAYEVLSVQDKRTAYDQSLFAPPSVAPGPTPAVKRKTAFLRKLTRRQFENPGTTGHINRLVRRQGRSDSFDDLHKLGWAGILIAALMFLVTVAVGIGTISDEPATQNQSERKAVSSVERPVSDAERTSYRAMACAAVPFAVILLSITLGYLATHRFSESAAAWLMLFCAIALIVAAFMIVQNFDKTHSTLTLSWRVAVAAVITIVVAAGITLRDR
jgi:hypothetical protein